MATYEITAELNLKNIIAELREFEQALSEFADNLEQIEKKYAEPQEREDKCIKCANNGMIDDECAYCTNHNLFKAESEEQG